MALTSNLYAMQDALLAALTSAFTAPVVVQLGDPGSGVRDQHVWIAEDATAIQGWATSGLGSQQREEVTTLRVLILARSSAKDFVAVRNIAKAMSDTVETAIRADLDLAGAVWGDSTEVVEIKTEGGAYERGRFCLVEMKVEATQFLA